MLSVRSVVKMLLRPLRSFALIPPIPSILPENWKLEVRSWKLEFHLLHHLSVLSVPSVVKNNPPSSFFMDKNPLCFLRLLRV